MAPQEIQAALRKSPFQPFRLIQTDDMAYDIRHPEMLMLGVTSAVVGVSADPAQILYDRMVILDLNHVIRIELLSQAAKSGNGQGH